MLYLASPKTLLLVNFRPQNSQQPSVHFYLGDPLKIWNLPQTELSILLSPHLLFSSFCSIAIFSAIQACHIKVLTPLVPHSQSITNAPLAFSSSIPTVLTCCKPSLFLCGPLEQLPVWPATSYPYCQINLHKTFIENSLAMVLPSTQDPVQTSQCLDSRYSTWHSRWLQLTSLNLIHIPFKLEVFWFPDFSSLILQCSFYWGHFSAFWDSFCFSVPFLLPEQDIISLLLRPKITFSISLYKPSPCSTLVIRL